MNVPGMSRLWKLTPVIALVTVIALLIAGALMARFIDHATAEQQVNEVSAQARVLATTVTAALAFNDHKAAQEYVSAVQANPEVEEAGIYDAKGALFASYPPNAADLPRHVEPSTPISTNDRLQVAVPVVQGDTPLGTVYLRTFIEPLARRVQRYGLIGLLVTMASVVVAVLGVTQAALARTNAELAARATELAIANSNLETQIAQREQAEAALRQAQKMEAIGQLTGGVAHDFNNLLQVILGNLERLTRRVESVQTGDGESMRLIGAVTRAAGRAATLTQRLLAFSRRQPLMPTTLDVNRLVVGMSELIGRTLGESIRTETVLSGTLWRVSADENQLESALLNLAVNARDAMPSGGRLTVETRNVSLDEGYARSQDDLQAGDYVLIAVTDTGIGMTKEVVARAFDPFFTTKDIGQGTGLGLSQVYGFVKQSGGHVRIDSEPGQGTTVKLYLPRLTIASDIRETPTQAPPVPRGAIGETILVVEDEEDVRDFTRDTLRDLGYAVREAGDGRAALRIVDSEPGLCLLFTDVGLPGGLDGRQLADEVLRRRPGLKVLFTTGYARNAIAHHGRLDAGVELLPKPFNAMELARKVRAVLDL